MASITESVDVRVPVRTAYNQWTQFEEFLFMEGVESVEQIDDTHLRWVAGAEVEHAWTAEIVEQRPDERVAWRAIEVTATPALSPSTGSEDETRDGADGARR